MNGFIEVVTVPPRASANVRLGQRLVLEKGRVVRIGQDEASDVVTSIFLSGAADFELLHVDGWRLKTSARCHAAFLNGKALDGHVDEPISAGDHLMLPNGLVLAFWPDGDDARLPAAVEARLLGDLDGSSSWQVVRDALLDEGRLLGRWLAEPTDEIRRRRLGPIALAVERGDINVRWSDTGFLEHVHLTPNALGERFETMTELESEWHLEALCRLPAARWLRSLELDVYRGAEPIEWAGDLVRQFMPQGPVAYEGDDPRVQVFGDLLRTASFRDCLRNLSFGYATPSRAFVEPFRASFPRLQGELVRVGSRASVVFESLPTDASVPAADGEGRVALGQSSELGSLVKLAAGQLLGARLIGLDDGWKIVGQGLHVNGLERSQWVLRPGDVCELACGIRFRFEWR